jgi:uncharacterized membrane protein YfcA
MSPLQIIELICLGLTAGTLAGMFGIGGGVIMVPVMMFLVGFEVRMAVGTSLAALLLPFSILGVWQYYKAGDVNVMAALLLVAGMFVGSYFGSKLSLGLSDLQWKRSFGVFLLLLSIKYLTGK